MLSKDKLKKTVAIVSAVFSFMALPLPSEASGMRDVMTDYITHRNGSISEEEAGYLADDILYYSSMNGIDPLLSASLMDVESSFRQEVVSPAGAIGIGQLMPDTARAIGVNPYNTAENIEGSCIYLGNALNRFSNTENPIDYALAAYNAGVNAVEFYRGVPPYRETQEYVKRINKKYMNLLGIMGELPSPQMIQPPKGHEPHFVGVHETEYVGVEQPLMDVLDIEDF